MFVFQIVCVAFLMVTVSSQEEDDPSCPEGEQYSDCPPFSPDSDYCALSDPAEVSGPAACGEPRCVCGFNRKRSRSTNQCIATADCPPFPCPGCNQEFNNCPPVCPGQACSDYINNTTCPKFGRIGIVVACQPTCRCKEGYYRDGDNNCILGSEC